MHIDDLSRKIPVLIALVLAAPAFSADSNMTKAERSYLLSQLKESD